MAVADVTPYDTSITRVWWRRLKKIFWGGLVPICAGGLLANSLHSRIYPSPPSETANQRSLYGPIHLTIRLAGTAPGIPEPLLVCGKAGRAAEFYIRIFSGSAAVGVDLWGQRLVESKPFRIPAQDGKIDLTFYIPAFFPEEGDSLWDPYGTRVSKTLPHRLIVVADGKAQINEFIDYPLPKHSPLYYGRNPIGGSIVSDYFTGVIDRISQSF